MHEANHPEARHFTEDVWKVDPRHVTKGRPVGLLWASPDCKHFSRAKGAKPVEKKIRSLAWVVVKWAAEVRPRVIILENVREFEDWGPLIPRWKCAECDWKGTEGQAKLARRRRACPRCDSTNLKESRDKNGRTELIPDPKRKGLTFRRWSGRLLNLGYKVEWRVLNAADYGAPTHRRRLFLIARRDGLPIVWPQPSHGDPKKIGTELFNVHLKPWRTAAECIDWDLTCPSIFDRKRPLAEATMRRIALGIKRYVLDNPQPFIVGVGGRMGQSPATGVDQPNNTVTAKNDRAIVNPVLVGLGGPERAGKPRDTDRPMGTVVSGGNKQALVGAFIAKHFGGVVGVPANTPLPTTTERGTQNQIVAANLVHMKNHTGPTGCDEPLRTAMSGGNHAALVYSFLTKYFGNAIGTSTDCFGLILVWIHREPYVIVDIGMRMLTPRELARGQGFPDSYILTGTKTSQVARIGNSVPPPDAEALVRANYIDTPMKVAA